MSHQNTPKSDDTKRTVTMLGKPGCHLCDEARSILVRLSHELEFELREVNILDDPPLRQRYQYAIPVVLVKGIPLLSGRIAELDARGEIKRAFGPEPLAEVPADEAMFLHTLQCPICKGELESRPRAVACLRCGHEFSRREGVLMLTTTPEPKAGNGVLDRLVKLIGFRLKTPDP